MSYTLLIYFLPPIQEMAKLLRSNIAGPKVVCPVVSCIEVFKAQVLAGRQATGVGIIRQHGQAVGPGHGGGAVGTHGATQAGSGPS